MRKETTFSNGESTTLRIEVKFSEKPYKLRFIAKKEKNKNKKQRKERRKKLPLSCPSTDTASESRPKTFKSFLVILQFGRLTSKQTPRERVVYAEHTKSAST